jgi:hypothetical protein
LAGLGASHRTAQLEYNLFCAALIKRGSTPPMIGAFNAITFLKVVVLCEHVLGC